MQAITFTRTRIAAAIGGLAVALAAGQAFGAAFALQEQIRAADSATRFAGGAAVAEDVEHDVVRTRRACRVRDRAGRGRPQPHHVRRSSSSDDGSRAGGVPAARRRRRRRRQLDVVPNLYVGVPINATGRSASALTRRSASTTEYDDGWIGRFQASSPTSRRSTSIPRCRGSSPTRFASARASTSSGRRARSRATSTIRPRSRRPRVRPRRAD